MFKLTKLIHFAANRGQAERDAVAAALRQIDGHMLVQPTLPGVYNGGDLIAHFQFEDERECSAIEPQIAATLATAEVGHVDSVAYAGGLCNVSEPRLENGVYRTLLLCVDRAVDPSIIEQFEAEMRMMPHYIPAIRNWQLSRVAHAGGSRRWTHVWEQEYSDIEGLMGSYMMHPYHWARIDRWFDPECTQWMINTTLCHSFCPLGRGILSHSDSQADGSRMADS